MQAMFKTSEDRNGFWGKGKSKGNVHNLTLGEEKTKCLHPDTRAQNRRLAGKIKNSPKREGWKIEGIWI